MLYSQSLLLGCKKVVQDTRLLLLFDTHSPTGTMSIFIEAFSSIIFKGHRKHQLLLYFHYDNNAENQSIPPKKHNGS